MSSVGIHEALEALFFAERAAALRAVDRLAQRKAVDRLVVVYHVNFALRHVPSATSVRVIRDTPWRTKRPEWFEGEAPLDVVESVGGIDTSELEDVCRAYHTLCDAIASAQGKSDMDVALAAKARARWWELVDLLSKACKDCASNPRSRDSVSEVLESFKSDGEVVLAQLRALAQVNHPAIDSEFYAACAADLWRLLIRRDIERYVEENQQGPLEQSASTSDANVALHEDDVDALTVLQRNHDELAEGETLHDDEIKDFAPGAGTQKPQRYCKVLTSFSWNAFNKARYDHKNLPPRSVQGYEFTIHYPLMAKKKFNLDTIFRVQYTEVGSRDEYVVIVFSVGPPYTDVAYRIVNRRWRRGSVKASFDSDGRFRLTFALESGQYRR